MDHLQCSYILLSTFYLQGMIHDPKKIIRQGRIIIVGQIVMWSYIIYLIFKFL